MKLCHAAALALVGWYLMMPPWDSSGRMPDLGQPLSKWRLVQSFDTAIACGAALTDAQAAVSTTQGKSEGDKQIAATVGRHAVCIASDDPRLKSK